MTHYYKAKNDNEIKIEFGCNHPDYENKVCDGNCAECNKSIAKLTMPAVIALLEAAGAKEV